MRKALVFDSSKCVGCLYCEMICSFRHKGLFSRGVSRVKIVTNEKLITHEAFFCAHCRTPICMEMCKLKSISLNKDSGLVNVDTTKCTGCGLCASGCPLGGMLIDQESEVAVSCDLCQGSPACVDFCPSGALQYSLS